MKIIEAMKRIKSNREKIGDLQRKIGQTSAHLSHETPVYDNPALKVSEWAQACDDLTQENIRLHTAISRTNLATDCTISLDGKAVTKSLAEWIWRRREYAQIDVQTWGAMTDRGLKEGQLPNTVDGGEPVQVKIVRNYDPELRDRRIDTFRSEPHEIDAALEVKNATTDLVELSEGITSP